MIGGFWIYCSTDCRTNQINHREPGWLSEAEAQTDFRGPIWDENGEPDVCRKCGDLDMVLEDLKNQVKDLEAMNESMKGRIDELKKSNDELVSSIEQLEYDKLLEKMLFIPEPLAVTEEGPSIGTKIKNRRRILILCDEYGRYVNRSLINLLKCDDYEIQVFMKPRACFRSILEGMEDLLRDFTSDDYVVVIGGANDFIDHRYPFLGDILVCSVCTQM